MQQQRPDNGQPGSERTEIRMLFDDDALYVGARMQDRSPVTRLLGRRDTFLECDWLGILLDPLLDRRTGNAFFVNPDGVQYDEVISNDDSEDTDWDGVWQSATSVDGGGWTAELRIPFSQLRIDNRERQLWGINFIRWIKRRQEQDRLFSHPRNQRGFASRFGTLAGLDGIKPRPKVEVAPYVVSSFDQARSVSVLDPLNERRSREVDGGLDLRWKARSNIAVAATLNPDFGQVEVDPAILNLSQFELFFPEKRPFFVEGAKIFTFGGIATEYASPFAVAQPVLFYSRRIGRVPQGNGRVVSDYVDLPDETSILGAAKVSGRLGATTFAVVGAMTQAEEARYSALGTVGERVVEPRSGYLALRATRDFERARIGGIVTSVTRQNDAATRGFLGSQATVAGVDGYAWFAKRTVLLDYFFAASSIRGSREAITVLAAARPRISTRGRTRRGPRSPAPARRSCSRARAACGAINCTRSPTRRDSTSTTSAFNRAPISALRTRRERGSTSRRGSARARTASRSAATSSRTRAAIASATASPPTPARSSKTIGRSRSAPRARSPRTTIAKAAAVRSFASRKGGPDK